MANNNLTDAIPVRLTQEQSKALENLKHIGFKRSLIIRLAINEYLYKYYRIIIQENKRVKCPF
jgi:hypothetical protein